jgi:hypothetical protein
MGQIIAGAGIKPSAPENTGLPGAGFSGYDRPLVRRFGDQWVVIRPYDDRERRAVVSAQDYDGAVSGAGAWWDSMLDKYNLREITPTRFHPDSVTSRGSATRQDRLMVFMQVASPADIKQLFKWDITLRAYGRETGKSGHMGWDFGIDRKDYTSEGLGYLPDEFNNANLTPANVNAYLKQIDAVPIDRLQEIRTALPYILNSRFAAKAEGIVSDDIVGQVGMGAWTAAAAYIITAGAAAVVEPALAGASAALGGEASTAGAITGSPTASSVASRAIGGAATSAITGGDPLRGAAVGAVSGTVADKGLGTQFLATAGANALLPSADSPTQAQGGMQLGGQTQGPEPNPAANLYPSAPSLAAPKPPTRNPSTGNSIVGSIKVPGRGTANQSSAGLILSAPKVPTGYSGVAAKPATPRADLAPLSAPVVN